MLDCFFYCGICCAQLWFYITCPLWELRSTEVRQISFAVLWTKWIIFFLRHHFGIHGGSRVEKYEPHYAFLTERVQFDTDVLHCADQNNSLKFYSFSALNCCPLVTRPVRKTVLRQRNENTGMKIWRWLRSQNNSSTEKVSTIHYSTFQYHRILYVSFFSA